MTLDHLGEPFKGSIWYWVESSYGAGESAPTLPVSLKVQDVRVGTGDRQVPIRGFDSPLISHLLEQTKEPTMHLEYIPQCDDTLIDDVIDRDSCCRLQSLSFCAGANTCISDADDQSYYYVKGAKPETVNITASKNEPYKVTIDFQCKSIEASTSATGSTPTALSGDYLQFNTAGEITKTGGHVVDTDHIAFILDSVNITITHQLNGYTDHDSTEKSFLVEGEMTVEGEVDISLDGGGASHFGEVLDNTAFTIQIDMGGSSCPRINLSNCEWKNSEVDLNISGEAQMESASFYAKPSSCSTIVTSVPE